MKLALALGLLAPLATASLARADTKAWAAAKKVIPANMEVVGGVNAAAAHDTLLYKKLMPALLAKINGAGELDVLKAECNIDIVSSIDSIVFALDSTEQSGTIVLAFRGVDRGKIELCARKHAKTNAQSLTITPAGPLTQYAGVGDAPVYLRWVAPDVVALATDPTNKDTALAATGGGIAGDPSLKGLDAVNKSASLWLVANKQVDMPGGAGKMTSAYGSANVASGAIAVETHIGVDSPATATNMAAMASQQIAGVQQQQPGPIADILKTVQISAIAQEIKVTATVPEKTLLDLLPMAGIQLAN